MDWDRHHYLQSWEQHHKLHYKQNYIILKNKVESSENHEVSDEICQTEGAQSEKVTDSLRKSNLECCVCLRF